MWRSWADHPSQNEGRTVISVIVPARDAAKTIAGCVQALLSQEGLAIGREYEVIVVDDGSKDETAHIASEFGVKVIHQERAGPAAARNTGARNARGDILAFTDADCAPSPTWLHDLCARFDDPQVVGVKGVYATGQHELVARFVQLEYDYKYVRMCKLAAIDFIDTNNAAYRKDVFLANEGFNESFPVPSVEDQEFSFKLARKGYRLLFAPDAAVFHLHDRSIGEYVRRKFGIGFWKAYMLTWTPEKTFSDSHTSPTQRSEILLVALMVALLPLAAVWPLYFLVLILITLAAFIITTSPFLAFVAKDDLRVLPIAPIMLLARAGALGLGLLKGFLLPPARGPQALPCQTMHARLLKRIVDVLGGCVGVVIFSPVIACAALAVLLDSRGPAFFRQVRAGENGRPFTLIKLRTMFQGADERVGEVLYKNKLQGPTYKIPDDPRVTKVGRFLRRWSLDELPQFWNVLKGEMSLVGPRPEELRIVDQYDDYQRQRLMVKPGLTGPMQVSGRGELDFDARMSLEIDYLRNYSLRRDFAIMLRTISAVLSGKGAS